MSNTAYKWIPEFETDACLGCGLCAKACAPRCIEMVWDFATLKRPEDCTGCGECLEACAHDVIRMDWVWMTGSPVIGRWCDAPEPAQVKPKRWLWGLLEPQGS